MAGWHERHLRADRLQRRGGLTAALGRPSLTLQHERAHGPVHRREISVEELLRLVCLRGHVRALTELQHRLLRRRPVAAGSGDEPALVVGGRDRRRGERVLDDPGQPRGVLAVQRRDRRDRSRIARGVAPALLDRRRADDDLVARLGERALGLARDQPRLARPGLRGLERERRLAFVAHAHEDVGVALRPEHELERLNRVAPRLRGVEGRTAAGEEQPRIREAAIGGHAAQPLRLGGDARARSLAVRHGAVYTIERR